jgi:hypothetical protein
MNSVKRMFIIFLTASASASLLTGLATASIPQPPIPEFTLDYIDASYDVPPTTASTINPYNNQTTASTTPGYHVNNTYILVSIKNHPFPSSVDGNKSVLYYAVRTKGHFGGDWTVHNSATEIDSGNLVEQSDTENTTIRVPGDYQANYTVDVQVMAVLGYQYSYISAGHSFPVPPTTVFTYISSAWSSTQTIMIPEASGSSFDSNQSVPESPLAMLSVLFTSITLVAIFCSRRLQRQRLNNLKHG